MRIVLISELTRLDKETAKEGTEDSVRRNYEPRVFIADVKTPHEISLRELSSIRGTLRRLNATVVECLRHEAQSFIFRSDDIVVIHGDDGAFVNIAKSLTSQRVITIATEAKPCGRLMRFTEGSFTKRAASLLGGTCEHMDVSIARAQTSLGHTLEAVNDFFVGRADLRSSRYAILQEEFMDQVSSGVIISTGTGSTGWERSARRTSSEYQEREPNDMTLTVTTRELCHGEDLGTLEYLDEITFRSNDNDTRVVADGVLLDASMLLLPAGATVTITANSRSIKLCI